MQEVMASTFTVTTTSSSSPSTSSINPAEYSGLTHMVGHVIESLKYFSHDFWNVAGDPRVSEYRLMEGGPWPTLSIIFMYLYFVKVAGPNLMQVRKPLDLRGVIFVYNVALVMLNGWFFYTGCWLSNFGIESWKCQLVDYKSYDPLDLYRIRIGWIFLISKIIDLCDTVFFILRKKQSQVTHLHVIHHSCMPLFCWIGVKFAAGGNSGFFPWINSGVHTIMYTYYALSTFDSLRPFLWWKQYITSIQMMQFVLVIVHSIYSMLIPGCQWPRVFMYLSIFNAFLFLFLFYSFFKRSYNNHVQRSRSPSPINSSSLSSSLSSCSKNSNGAAAAAAAIHVNGCRESHPVANGHARNGSIVNGSHVMKKTH